MSKARSDHSPNVAASPRGPASIDVREVYRDHADFVWQSLARFGVHPNDLTDMTQEVFIVVHRQADRWRPEGRVTSWLYGICRRVAADYRRRAHRRYEEVVAQAPESPDTHGSRPDERVAKRQAQQQLTAILDTLKPDQRAVFVMFEIDEMRCEAIAELTGVPLGTVFSRLRAARKSFERALKRRLVREARKSE